MVLYKCVYYYYYYYDSAISVLACDRQADRLRDIGYTSICTLVPAYVSARSPTLSASFFSSLMKVIVNRLHQRISRSAYAYQSLVKTGPNVTMSSKCAGNVALPSGYTAILYVRSVSIGVDK